MKDAMEACAYNRIFQCVYRGMVTLAKKKYRPHPEEHRIVAARLEGLQPARSRTRPSFETRARARAPQDEA
jgi:hypothetical protein